jgi:hypothetical protein
VRTWQSHRFVERVESSIGVRLEYSAIAGQVPLRILAPTIARIEERRRWRDVGIGATYTCTGTAVAFIVSELLGGRAEALFIAMAALGAHGGRAIHKKTMAQAVCRAVVSA